MLKNVNRVLGILIWEISASGAIEGVGQLQAIAIACGWDERWTEKVRVG
jgi:hypothetical protein